MVALYKAPPGTAPPSLRVREGMSPAQDPTARAGQRWASTPGFVLGETPGPSA